MAKKALTGLSSAMLGVAEPVPSVAPSAASSPAMGAAAIALTLKVSPSTYQRLKALGACRRQSNQAILSAALEAYLDREEAS